MVKKCFHCGLDCAVEKIVFDEKNFCCLGCKTVYEILNVQDLNNFYNLNQTPGIKPESVEKHEFDFLNTHEIQEVLLLYKDDKKCIIEFKIPVIHCSSCVWVLESLHTIFPAIEASQVHFSQKKVSITYNPTQTTLSNIAEFLTQLGYKPVINLEQEDEEVYQKKSNRRLITQLGVAGFCFGNVMLFAFPDYLLEHTDQWYDEYKVLFRYLMFIMSLPVVLYSARDYFKSAFLGLKNKLITIDIPISIGILVLFFRSCYEAYFDISSGYFDSLCGLIFFMLIGKFFQQRTYKSMSFDRDYRSFYPLSITKIIKGIEKHVLLHTLEVGDRIIIRNQEMIPADAILIKGEAHIDNSFITGESDLVDKNIGDKIYAGGKQNGALLELEIIKKVNQSYLTQLWQNAGDTTTSAFSTLIQKVSKVFTILVLAIALLGGIYWYFIDVSQMFQVVTAVLIVACPCALSLATPFTLGNVLRILGLKNVYCKDIGTLEKLATITHIVFDKTGTLTQPKKSEIFYEGIPLSDIENSYVKSVFQNSTHPLSRKVVEFLEPFDGFLELSDYKEIAGKGIQAQVHSKQIKLGSASFVQSENKTNNTEVYVSINNQIMGKYIIKQKFRNSLSQIVQSLSHYKLSVLSGDNDKEKKSLQNYFGMQVKMLFNQSPKDKVSYIKNTQKNQKVMMIGDGLNDAIALNQSNVGIAISEDLNTFTPASDIILKGEKLHYLPKILKLSKTSIMLVKYSMFISFLYNVIGLSFALTGNLSPLVAAILMPISSITVVLFATLSTWYLGNKMFKNG